MSSQITVLELLLATQNKGKLLELQALTRDLPVDVVSLATALPGKPQAAEDGVTFLENARIKAVAAASATMMVTLAEDAGLEVDALGGRPGVRSARFAGEHATDAENNAALLKALQEVEDAERTARFRCVMILVDPWAAAGAEEIVAEGSCEGRIARAPKGSSGFGYDPLFVVADGTERTMAELGDAEKNAISHRARAFAALRPRLEALLERRLVEARGIDREARRGGPEAPPGEAGER